MEPEPEGPICLGLRSGGHGTKQSLTQACNSMMLYSDKYIIAIAGIEHSDDHKTGWHYIWNLGSLLYLGRGEPHASVLRLFIKLMNRPNEFLRGKAH